MKKLISSLLVMTLLLTLLPANNAKASSALPDNVAEYYRGVIENSKYVTDSDKGIYNEEGTQFLLYDVNKDGVKELIVWGSLGLRCKMFSVIYTYDGSEFHHKVIDGEPVGVTRSAIAFSDPDYEQAGMYRYERKLVYSISNKAKKTIKLRGYRTRKFNEKTQKYKTVKNVCYKGMGSSKVKITRTKFNKLYKAYGFKTVGTSVKAYEATLKNAETYIK
ncbi:MAG: hypothetical protein K6A30_03160 [Lachnospiraceae bacterium]|nr:hypothetical protein [Lachnospiraceae bacterium]